MNMFSVTGLNNTVQFIAESDAKKDQLMAVI